MDREVLHEGLSLRKTAGHLEEAAGTVDTFLQLFLLCFNIILILLF